MTAAKKTARRPVKATETVDAASDTAFAFSDAARDQFETAMKAFNDNAEEIRTRTEETMSLVRDSFEQAREKMQAVNSEMVAAAREEVTEAVEFANELARARTMADALEIQRNYWTRLFETRVERTRALTQASIDATREMFEPMARNTSAPLSAFAGFEKFFPFAAR